MGRRKRVFLLAAGLIALAGLVFFWFGFVEPIRSHSRWYSQVRADINSLSHKRPPEVSKEHWEFIVDWTNNMHANCGSIRSSVEAEWRDGFAAEFNRRLAGPITLADIDWIWDEYAAHTSYGQTYSDKWRPTKVEGFK